MKRFIDLRGQYTGHRFAWWCTVRDEFEMYGGDMAWLTWRDFIDSVEMSGLYHVDEVARRYRPLAPDWAHEPDPDDDFDEDTVNANR
jgi:hypothetical protein